jgi:branched-chain amino acid transport system substrate-binding protein
MKSLLTALLLLALSLGAAADPPPITLGGLFNLTGRQANLDVPASRGAQLAVEQANRSGGVLGRQVQLLLVDGQSDLKAVVDKTRELLAMHPRLAALLGFSDSDFVLATAPLAAKQRLPFVTSGATSPRLTREVPAYLFMACFGDNEQAAAGAEFAASDLKARTAFVIYDESTEYTRLLQQYFTTRFQELGGKVVGTLAFSPENVDRLPLEAARADVIFLSAGPQEAKIGARRLRELGLDAPILGGDGYDSDVWASPPEIEDVYFTSHVFLGQSNTRPEVVKFRQDFLARYPEARPDAFAALGYDTVNLLLAAARKAGSSDPEAVRAALAGTSGFQGVTGTISFDGNSRIPSKSVSVLRIVKGHPELVKEVTPQSIPAP